LSICKLALFFQLSHELTRINTRFTLIFAFFLLYFSILHSKFSIHDILHTKYEFVTYSTNHITKRRAYSQKISITRLSLFSHRGRRAIVNSKSKIVNGKVSVRRRPLVCHSIPFRLRSGWALLLNPDLIRYVKAQGAKFRTI